MKRYLLLSLLGLALYGCAATAGSDAAFLLEQDYHQMSDQELIAHEQELSDTLLRSSRSSGSGLSVGLGLFSWGGSGGIGVSTGQRIGDGTGDDVSELRNRRDEVRGEMRERGLLR